MKKSTEKGINSLGMLKSFTLVASYEYQDSKDSCSPVMQYLNQVA